MRIVGTGCARRVGGRIAWLVGLTLLPWNPWAASAALEVVRTANGPVLRLGEGREVRLQLAEPRELSVSQGSAGRYWIAATEEVGGGVRLRLFGGSSETSNLESGASSPVAIPNPSRDSTLLQLSPTWLITPTQSVLAWLEGHDIQRLSVRAASWTGSRWVHPRLIAPPGPGSQLALTGAIHEGKPLLAWTAFDGKDDEILWSRWDGRRWTRAQRLAADNRVPDVTPSLTVTAGKVLAAWARYDGAAYRVVVSTFVAGRWQAPRNVGAPSTSFPRFVVTDAGLVLLARQTPPPALVAYELDAQGGWTGRFASTEDPQDLRLAPFRVAVVTANGQGLSVADERGRQYELHWEAPAPPLGR